MDQESIPIVVLTEDTPGAALNEPIHSHNCHGMHMHIHLHVHIYTNKIPLLSHLSHEPIFQVCYIHVWLKVWGIQLVKEYSEPLSYGYVH